jgi:hypothetical protein
MLLYSKLSSGQQCNDIPPHLIIEFNSCKDKIQQKKLVQQFLLQRPNIIVAEGEKKAPALLL